MSEDVFLFDTFPPNSTVIGFSSGTVSVPLLFLLTPPLLFSIYSFPLDNICL